MKIVLLLSSLFMGLQLYAKDCRVASKDTIPSISKYLGDNVIKSSSGFVSVYEKNNQILLEIPDSIVGRDILVTITILKGVQKNDRKANKRFGYGDDSMPENMVRFEKKDDVISLVSPVVYYIEDDSFMYNPFYKSLINPTIKNFSIVATSDNKYLIDITDYYLGDSELFALQGSKTELDLGNYIKESSYSTEIVSYPTNISFRSVRTYTASKPNESTYSNNIWEVGALWILLPEKPLKIRLFDERVGYFASHIRGQLGNENEVFQVAKRWRLEPKPEDVERYLKGELVVPQKPIVFYIDKDMPTYLVPHVIKGVALWQKAFEKAGFKNAIYALPEPTKEEDPDYSSDDARYSVISYKASPIANAYGSEIIDPRSGEIISAQVAIFHAVTDLIQMSYFVMSSPSDPMAREYPLNQDLMGKLFSTVITHEVGHTLGLRHNFMGSSFYPVDSLRNNDFIEKNGLGTSVMDYQRFNFIAQPEDHIAQKNLIPKLGTYDVFAIEWGYRYYPDALKTPILTEKLNDFVKEEMSKGGIGYLEEKSTDPRVQSEDSGDDIIYASRLGIKNLKYIMANIEQWTENQDDYTLLKRRYLYLARQYHRYVNHVMSFIGAYYKDNIFSENQNYAVEYKTVSYEDHVRALQFLNEYMLEEPLWLTKPSFLNKINLEEDKYNPFENYIYQLELRGLVFNNSEIKNDNPMTNEELLNFLFEKLFLNKEKNKQLSEFEKRMQNSYLSQLNINIGNQNNVSFNNILTIQSQIYKIKAFAEKKISNTDSLTKAHYLGMLNFIKIWEQGNQKL
ncbi:zinc-dependent metalloprotease [Mariniflexile sp. HMF6888]|uniref:zinc-dependent metalloprotease n=1 Tax=Mariniflexile sp. HMF6888 TaxID=3373086 RepID=UPI0037A32D09